MAQVFSIFEDLGISVDVVATSEVSISLTLDPAKIWSRELIQQVSGGWREAAGVGPVQCSQWYMCGDMLQELDKMTEKLREIALVKLLPSRSVISLIGNVQKTPEILERVSWQAVIGPMRADSRALSLRSIAVNGRRFGC